MIPLYTFKRKVDESISLISFSMVKRILIPNGSVVQLEMSILNGGHNDPSQGWTDNCASKSESGSIYLRVEYAVTKGPYANVKFRSSIGLKSPKGPWWRKRGQEFITQLLNYKHNLSASDLSINARQMRRPKNFRFKWYKVHSKDKKFSRS